ncbi:MAG TPA: helix-turn-helix transcriptional regulator [Solirubrobacteraceae bacterium]|nr:helix-turn-helix transcriptional regulator [Solirubrobacteraceae bacterium]
MRTEIGRRLARLRLERNWTQAELAAAAGVGQATVQRVERGDSVQVTSLLRLLRTLDLLAGLDRAIPEAQAAPIAELERRARTPRRRARRSRAAEPAPDGRPWRWGDEDAGGR